MAGGASAYSFGGHNYEVYLFPTNCGSDCSGRSWDTAKDLVSKLGPDWYLATITSQPEQAAVQTYVSSFNLQWPNELWLGGYQKANSPEPTEGWTWVTGEAWNPTNANWSTGEPNNQNPGAGGENHLGLWGYNGAWGPLGSWNDEGNLCNIAGFIAEKGSYDVAPVPEPATMLLLGLGLVGLAGLGKKKFLKRS